MKKMIWLVIIILLLVLDWLALDDITTGQEPNYFLEYGILTASGLIFGYLLLRKLRLKLDSIRHRPGWREGLE